MRKILFDSSVHLGQFALDNEDVRKGCKNLQIALVEQGDGACEGAWTDFENGRVDNLIWSISRKVQDVYYPFMDHFFSVANVAQLQTANETEEMASRLKEVLPDLSFYSRLNIALAKLEKREQIYTLFSEMLELGVNPFSSDAGNIDIIYPVALNEMAYPDASLEDKYQDALSSFRANQVDLLRIMKDSRRLNL